MDDYIDTYDPESSYLVKLGPGGSETFEIKSSQISCLRVSDGESVESDLIMVDESGNELVGRAPRFSIRTASVRINPQLIRL